MQLTIDLLKQAAAWPGTGQRTLVVLASQLAAAGLYQQGLKYFAARPDAAPADTLWRALAGAFELRLDGRWMRCSATACAHGCMWSRSGR